ncbi:bifunctional DNA-binding transcriptional regulator/O6-methylguanine-DNA methyltransferase Ada [Methylosinus sp. Ce-a6]|uniref:bifunctional DNA-binding transcriptional regulator/O6-methylguanine-DNA methyltransferase Ada n=1 Tax=Methylosinus sp. Ce-a6 TaxID=2172005 RepID=UPI00135B6AAC|nr:bifunctional DNA-binding transcriptional regulator/O6-methylguanine-DNA methyltransferase Ada [Methylosinus sp. Ce-a6]
MDHRALGAEEMLRAVATRDKAYDSLFLYGVKTTRIFCRPSCPSRAANPENLRFFGDVVEARAAGYRACRRCRPEERPSDTQKMQEVARLIEQHAEETLPLSRLAASAGLSATHMQKVFKSVFGVSPKVYQQGLRARRLKELLREGDEVTGAIYEAGYGSPSRVYGEGLRDIGMTPSAYRKGGAGETINYACRHCTLGPLMMAATNRGVCFVMFGESEASLLDALAAEFPKARLQKSAEANGEQLGRWIDALDEHLARRGPRPDLPLDLRGTAFQLLVWRFLIGIPEGNVVSYADVAAGIGKPKAHRAVASACAANRVAVLAPCHRVLRGDGGVGGYRWGVDRKRALLDMERAHMSEARKR